ncbi:MAG: MBL fold metallo-hydrolase [Planctomycetia bacterium]
MLKIHHLNAGTLHAPPNPPASCHCLVIEDDAGLALVDAGVGLRDVADPEARIGRAIIDAAGFQFDESQTAYRRIEALGLRPDAVRHVVLSHGDPDHAGGLADFPGATVHVGSEELAAIEPCSPRYRAAQFDHRPLWQAHGTSSRDWFGLEARPLELGFAVDVLLIPLFGHTLGHCGVAIQTGAGWLLYVGDAYYLRVELTTDDHPVSVLAAARAEDDSLRRATLEHLRRLNRDHANEIQMFGYHDFGEFPS